MQLARVAQWIEYLTSNQMVGGSSPSAGIFYVFYSLENVKHGLNTMFIAHTEHLTLNLKLFLCS